MGTQAGTAELEQNDAPETPAESIDDTPSSEEGAAQDAVETPEAPKTLSMTEAFEAAQETLGEPENEEPPTEPATDTPAAEEGEAPPEETPQETPSPTTQESTYKQAWEDFKAGRHDKVPLGLRSHFSQVTSESAERAQTQAAQDQQFKDLYLGYLAMQEENPEEFNALIMDRAPGTTGRPKGLEVQEFMNAYHTEHPDVSLENPDAPTMKRGDVRAAAIREVTTHIDSAVETFATNMGLTSEDVDAAYKESKGNLADFLVLASTKAADARVEAEVAKRLPKIEQENREAAAMEAQAKITAGAPASARRFASTASGKKPRSTDPMTAAWQRAKEIVEP